MSCRSFYYIKSHTICLLGILVGVEEAELPQFTIIGYETNDRKEKLATGIYQRLSLSFKLQVNKRYLQYINMVWM